MSSTITRKATFNVAKVKGSRIFTPVNKRAKTVARKAGKRTKVTVADLKKLQGSGTYTYWAYTSAGTLKRIKL